VFTFIPLLYVIEKKLILSDTQKLQEAKEQLSLHEKALADKEEQIENIIQENEHELAITKEALENKSKELKSVKAALNGTNDASKKLAQIEEEKKMFQMELLALTEQVNEAQDREKNLADRLAVMSEEAGAEGLADLLQAKEEELKKAIQEGHHAMQEVENLRVLLGQKEEEMKVLQQTFESKPQAESEVNEFNTQVPPKSEMNV
jgi:DNA repair exonuclease SbcCD ATPase subunit